MSDVMLGVAMLADPIHEKEIFLGATELADEAARAAYLDRACAGDVGLRERLKVLLRSHATAESFLGFPAAGFREPHDGTVEFADVPVQGVCTKVPESAPASVSIPGY